MPGKASVEQDVQDDFSSHMTQTSFASLFLLVASHYQRLSTMLGLLVAWPSLSSYYLIWQWV